MYYSYESSKRNSSKANSVRSSFCRHHDKTKSLQPSTPNSISIMNFDLTMNFSQKPPAKYMSSRQYQEANMQKLQQTKQKALQKINSIKLGNNCQLTETSNIQEQDCQKLMNFIIGGYVDNDFNQYLSIKEFNEKKEDFEVLNDIYEEKMKQWYAEKGKKISNDNESNVATNKRSLLSMIYLNQNVNKITRVKIEEHMKKNKMVW